MTVKRSERSNGPDTVLYKNYLYLLFLTNLAPIFKIHEKPTENCVCEATQTCCVVLNVYLVLVTNNLTIHTCASNLSNTLSQ